MKYLISFGRQSNRNMHCERAYGGLVVRSQNLSVTACRMELTISMVHWAAGNISIWSSVPLQWPGEYVLLFFAMPSPWLRGFWHPRKAHCGCQGKFHFHTKKKKKVRGWCIIQVLQNHTGLKNRQYKKYQVIECFRDPQVLMLFAIVFNVFPAVDWLL